ncbi:Ppx/GppA phosphatase family protein [Natronoglycomyces albus]|uniref:Ppx/GppA family phosphatase n=1 Tax=Natronoglycomyces albus TaxID=2811108 RepID=A0A895XQM2_9ACTN|nr:Ppx/GppA phosphatase family protein [Natronoglycomyces albus]QSB04570.1 Ppx/GppA family phosphatase [Natronoglycomyces albus]
MARESTSTAASGGHRVAGIDCGTNSIRLLIAEVGSDGRLADIVRRMEVVRLGEGVDKTGRLAPAAIERTRLALEGYAAQISDHDVQAVRMVATSATRDAANSGEFTAMVTATLGTPPEVISGDEEARLSFGGAVATMPEVEGQRLVIDIGGGSTEFVRGEGTAVLAARSVDIGCVRMTERHIHSDPPAPTELATAQADISALVDSALATVDPQRLSVELVGVAGTVTTVAGIALDLDKYDADAIDGTPVTYEQVCQVADRLATATHEQRLAIGVMHPGRADVIIGGSLVLRTIMERTGASSVIASEHDILDGIAASAGK